jgi:hypothetical protein
MQMQNYIRITIHKVKFIPETSNQNFNLKIDLFKKTQEIEKLTQKETNITKVK